MATKNKVGKIECYVFRRILFRAIIYLPKKQLCDFPYDYVVHSCIRMCLSTRFSFDKECKSEFCRKIIMLKVKGEGVGEANR